MNKLLVALSVFVVSCTNIKNNSFVAKEEIKGNWLILYPKHVLKNDVQRQAYTKAQDSIVNLMGLKLITFRAGGNFLQADSIFNDHGSWNVDDTGRIGISSGGKGFEKFNGTIVGVVNDTILIEEILPLENIKLIWHLKKITEQDEAGYLFKEGNNSWRRRPQRKESDDELKARVISMLKYYSLYFKVVSKESIYFSPARVFLPFRYYQHSVGLKPMDDDFVHCFFDADDAGAGYKLIRDAFELTRQDEFPSGENFVIEYADYFEKLSKVIQ